MERSIVVKLFEQLIATNPKLERKGDTMPYTSLNGHMIGVVHKDNTVALRLPPDVRETFLTKYKAKLSEQYGMVQREYVVVPDALLARTAELKTYLDAGYAYVAALRPKPTTKAKKAGVPAKKAGTPAKKATPARQKAATPAKKSNVKKK